VTTALYIVLGILVVAVIAMQVWMARSQAPLAGDRAALVRTVRIANVVLLGIAAGLVVYVLATAR
jgi:hypothetical protein